MGAETHPQRDTVAQALDELGTRFGKLAISVVEGEKARELWANPNRPSRVVYPTRLATRNEVYKCLMPFGTGGEAYGYTYGKTEEFPQGCTPGDLFYAAADYVMKNTSGDDEDAALGVLQDYYEYATAYRLASGELEFLDHLAAVLSNADEIELEPKAGDGPSLLISSLWRAGVMAALPNEPQTPGSPAWEAAEAAGNPHESVQNPFVSIRSR